MRKAILLGSLFVLIVALLGCSSGSGGEVTPDTSNSNNEALVAAEDYFNNTLKTVITSNCISCHSNYHSGSNSSNYSVFNNAKTQSTTMYNYVNSGTMPQDAAKLSATEISKFNKFKVLVEAINK